MKRPKIGVIYRHFRGNTYLVLGFATHSETNSELVLYQNTKDTENKVWARPVSMWFSKVDNGHGHRFVEV